MAGDESDKRDSPPIPPEARGDEPMEPDLVLDSSDDGGAESDGVEKVELDQIDGEWAKYFRYDSAYSDQVDAINNFIDLLGDNGYYLLEGACGTGKTLAAITGGIYAIRDRRHLSSDRCDAGETFPNYSQILAVTPVKQQLKQFVEEMKGVNTSLPAETKQVPTVVMRGRGDMMPYGYADIEPFDSGSVSDQIDPLREMTRKIIKFDSDIPLDWPDGAERRPFSHTDYNWDQPSAEAEEFRERHRYDPYRAKALKDLVMDMVESGDDGLDRLTVNGVETPFPEYVPHSNDIVNVNKLRQNGGQLREDLQGRFDPFYAGFFAGEGDLPFGFGEAESFVFDQTSLFEAAAKRGICPHEAMAHFAGEAEVVLGNYTHLFDPQTRLLTDDKIGLLDENTITVVDEAHQIERKVRDMLSAELDIYTLDRAINDIEIIRETAVGDYKQTKIGKSASSNVHRSPQVVKTALETAGSYSVSVDDLAEVEQFFRLAKQKLGEYGSEKLNERYTDVSWRRAVNNWGPEPLEKPLADPDSAGGTDDFFTDVVSHSKFDKGTFIKSYQVMLGVKFAYDALESEGIYDRTPQGVEVGEFFRRWATEDTVEYFRHTVLDDRVKSSIPDSFPEWVRGWTPSFQLFNCVPRDELSDVFAELGGGVLMSATIQPEDVFMEAVGIDEVPYPSDWGEDADDSSLENRDDAASENSDTRPVKFDQYPLRFPVENRLSMTVDLPKYTNKNRGKPTQDVRQMTTARKKYAKALRDIVATQGNVMVAMPNYREAQWAYEFIESRDSSKRLHLDQSSTDNETTETLDAFFEPGDSVIFTSCRGTITEGVDYDGGKLHCCVAVGIPLLPSHTPRIQAVRTAYDERMESRSGFETALTIPAVRKVRQAFGRVIRGSDENGVRVLLDGRYASASWDGVEEYLSEQEQSEFNSVSPDWADQGISAFWDEVGGPSTTRPSDTDSGNKPSPNQSDGHSEESDANVEQANSPAGEGSSELNWGEVDPTKTAKIYFGQEAELAGWTTVQAAIAEEEIVPLVREYEVDDPDSQEAISLNFSKDLSASGWTKVRADAVLEKIEPIAENAHPDAL